MNITIENMNFSEFTPWAGAKDTFNEICNAGKAELFEALMDELYPDGMTDVQLNDLLWHESDWCLEQVGLPEEEEEEEEA